ncbi:MAG: hypothetical protein ACREQT_01865 [Candidatus Binataceae bacterium]
MVKKWFTAIRRRFLERSAGIEDEQVAALDDLMELSRRAKSRHAGTGRWSRDELHARA